MDQDLAIRLEAFKWLSDVVATQGDVLPRTLLQNGFEFNGARIPLVAPQGIFKPRMMAYPLTITTTVKGPYRDTFGADGLLSYRYRGIDPNHPDNVGLREAMRRQRPLIYLHAVVPGKYLAVWPVFCVGDDPDGLTFRVAVDEASSLDENPEGTIREERVSVRRAYITRTVRMRLHQRTFRERVLEAYHSQCSLCKLRQIRLLDAAHLIPDEEPQGEPHVTNGISLCRLHHAAFDAFIIGIDPDFRIHVRDEVLAEEDGPTLRFALQALHGSAINLPRSEDNWPDREALEWRFDRFKTAV